MMKYTFFFLLLLIGCCIVNPVNAQTFTRQDTLRGTITVQRAWWDLKHYHLDIEIDPKTKTIKGKNKIDFFVLIPHQTMQIDLQDPLKIDRVLYKGNPVPFRKDGFAHWVQLPEALPYGARESIVVEYSGTPIEAKRPPWDGGFTWSMDTDGYPFVATSCQGLGASAWWPCKDHMYDEPDSMHISVTCEQPLSDVSNGRLISIDELPDGRRRYNWFVTNPINNYGVNVNVARYVHWSDTLHGEKGVLDMNYYVLEKDLEKAKIHFEDASRTIRAFEYWFGPYPFYEDGYKLVQVPYLGMEHQSSVTYGNHFMKGYLGRDLSNTGWGLKWDFIIVHETAHEWWANSITYKDIADMWIHESFANYAESLFIDYYYGAAAANEYVVGLRENIENDRPIIGFYGVNSEGSSDMYYKGGNMLHTIRGWLQDDALWRDVLRGLQKTFYHQTVETKQIEDYMIKHTGLPLQPLFNQYLRDIRIPKLEYKMKGKNLLYRYVDILPDFQLPLKVKLNNSEWQWIEPTSEWKQVSSSRKIKDFTVDDHFYIKVSAK